MTEPLHYNRPVVRYATNGEIDGNPKSIGILALLAEDFRTHGSDPFSPGFWALAVHRFGNWRMGVRRKLLRAPLTAMYRTADNGVVALWGISLPYKIRVGRRLRLGHHGCMIMGAKEIGDDVTVQNNVTIGLFRRNAQELQTIGNRVELGAGACIVGGVSVGDDCYVGPKTVLARSIKPGTAVLGIPTRQVDREGLQKVANDIDPKKRGSIGR